MKNQRKKVKIGDTIFAKKKDETDHIIEKITNVSYVNISDFPEKLISSKEEKKPLGFWGIFFSILVALFVFLNINIVGDVIIVILGLASKPEGLLFLIILLFGIIELSLPNYKKNKKLIAKNIKAKINAFFLCNGRTIDYHGDVYNVKIMDNRYTGMIFSITDNDSVHFFYIELMLNKKYKLVSIIKQQLIY